LPDQIRIHRSIGPDSRTAGEILVYRENALDRVADRVCPRLGIGRIGWSQQECIEGGICVSCISECMRSSAWPQPFR
jgi:hypothetical protein